MAGFSQETFDFIADLRRNNNKKWFDKNRERYEEHYLEPAKQFVTDAGEALSEIAPDINAEPRVNGSIFRINRDIRFSKDKTPYKDHLDLWFWEGDRKTALSGFYLRLTPDSVTVGAGAHRFDTAQLARYRDGVASPASGRALLSITSDMESYGYDVLGEEMKKLPRNFAAEGETARFLRFKALYVHDEGDHPGVVGNARFVNWCARRWEKQAPLHRWLQAYVA